MIDTYEIEKIKNARAYTKNAIEQIMVETGVTPPIMDLIVCEVLADIRKYEIHFKGTDVEGANQNGEHTE